MAIVLVVTGDTHPNSYVGLSPPTIELEGIDEQWTYIASTAQRELYNSWLELWQRSRLFADEHDAKLYGVHNGDGADDNYHSKGGLISQNPSNIVRLGAGVLQPARDVCDEFFVVKGTRAHVGEHGYHEENIARAIGATRDERAGSASWWFLPLDLEGLYFHIAHHPYTFGTRPWTAVSAAARESSIILHKTTIAGQPVPDVVLRSHCHYGADSGMTTKPRVFFCWPWQITTTYGIRLGAAGEIVPVGAWVFLIEDGHYTVEPHLWWPRSKEHWTAP
ncbi:MAG: hypothetical protein KKC55_17250 [Gammaproteobacteria bacterium]|nr:hypothetical protein [Gammaproteobacteria bacterium]